MSDMALYPTMQYFGLNNPQKFQSWFFCTVLQYSLLVETIWYDTGTVIVSTKHVESRNSQLAYAMVEVKSGIGLGKGLGKGGSLAGRWRHSWLFKAAISVWIVHMSFAPAWTCWGKVAKSLYKVDMYPKRLVTSLWNKTTQTSVCGVVIALCVDTTPCSPILSRDSSSTSWLLLCRERFQATCCPKTDATGQIIGCEWGRWKAP